MRKTMDDELSLERLLKRAKQLDPSIRLRVYFDPTIRWFYINFVDTLQFWVPDAAVFLFECNAGLIDNALEMYISNAVRISTKPVQL